VEHVHWGRLGYDEAHRRQRAARAALMAGEGPEVVFTVEHPPVLTGGRRASEDQLLVPRAELESRGVAVREIERGGDWTYHGPGQLVAYPIVDLRRRRLRVPCFVAGLQDAMERLTLEVLRERGVGAIAAAPRTDAPGAWVRAAEGPPMKVGAVGVHIRRSVTLHGLALNVDPDPWGFGWIVPCGLVDEITTSWARLLRGSGGDPADLPSLESLALRLVASLPGCWARRV
jgi:lipoate-protein ligase B